MDGDCGGRKRAVSSSKLGRNGPEFLLDPAPPIWEPLGMQLPRRGEWIQPAPRVLRKSCSHAFSQLLGAGKDSEVAAASGVMAAVCY